MSSMKVSGRDHRWVTSQRFPIQSLWFVIAATPKKASEKNKECYAETCTVKMQKEVATSAH